MLIQKCKHLLAVFTKATLKLKPMSKNDSKINSCCKGQLISEVSFDLNQRTNENIFCISALVSKHPYKVVETKDKTNLMLSSIFFGSTTFRG